MLSVAPEVPAARAASLSRRVERSFDAFANRQSEWDDAALACDAAVYMTFDWLKTWWEFYGEGRELRLFVFTIDDRIVGMVPSYIDDIGVGIFSLRVARLIGSNLPPKVFNPPVPATHAAEIWTNVFEYLFTEDNCDIASFGPISETHSSIRGLEPSIKEGRTAKWSIKIASEGVHTTFFLPDSMEAYFGSLGKNERKNRRKYELRVLQRDYPTTRVEVVSDPGSLDREFESFADQHRRQWAFEGKPGHFGSWPKGFEFNRALVKNQGAKGRVRFIRIVAGDKVIANQYVFAFGPSYTWELPSREAGHEWDRFSLGPTSIVTMIQTAIGEGLTRIEGGLAHYDYKLRLGAKENHIKVIRAVAVGYSRRLRLGLFSLARSFLRLVYVKIWRRRLAPKISSRFGGPPLSIWLRFDF